MRKPQPLGYDPWVNVIKLFSSSLKMRPNKLECLSFESVVYYLRVRPEAKLREKNLKGVSLG